MSIKINEIFFSIQGESSLAGWPTVFIRTSGCHLRCTYCDTTYAYYDGSHKTLEELVNEVKKHPAKHVCLTGGEPLLQPGCLTLMTQLCDLGYTVSLETSGDLDCSMVDERVIKIIDIKTPDSGEPGRFHPNNLKLTGVNTEFKFVICSEEDFIWADNFVRTHKLNAHSLVFFSPAHKEISPQYLAEKILSLGVPARLQLQQHKYIWSSDARGV